MQRTRRRLFVSLVLMALLAAVLVINRTAVLRGLGAMLVRSDTPSSAEVAIVLAGDFRGNRILKACELVRAGLVREVWISGPTELTWYGTNEADAAIRFAAGSGCDTSRLRPIYMPVLSTADEAARFGDMVRQRGLGRILLVTGASHTARAGREFDAVLPSAAHLSVVAAPERYFSAETWWHTREGQKMMFFEMSKTVASYLGI